MAKQRVKETAEEPVSVEQPVATPEVAEPSRVRLTNLGSHALYVPLQSGLLRLGPKSSETVDAAEVTGATRQVGVSGRIVIHNQ